MNRYVMMLRGGSSMLGWTYEFHEPSNGMAIEFAHKAIANCAAAGQAMWVDLFNIDTDDRVMTFRVMKKQTVERVNFGEEVR